ncbi:MAG: cellobiose phosphorylase [Candidatus Omnitrophota bacterium]
MKHYILSYAVKNKKIKYYLNAEDKFVIENYNLSAPFANFLPGIAGPYGIPIWVFYVNRGQAISCFGTKDKDHAILEFLPANKAWQLTSLQGFRTFIKLSSKKNSLFYEPFANGLINSKFNLNNRLEISSYDLKIQEDNLTLGLQTRVEYWTIPSDNFGGLVRIVNIKNTSKTAKRFQILDGLPQIVPFGTNNWCLKKMSRTIEAWMTVLNMENKVPFYKLAVDPADKPEVVHLKEGNFYLTFHYEKEKPKIIKPIIDPQHIFGHVTDFTCPYEFLNTADFRYPKTDTIQSKTPCGFLLSDVELAPFKERTFYSVFGYMINQEVLNSSIPKITNYGYIAKKREQNKKIIEELQEDINTLSGRRQFDLYCRQTYLDNILRGGYPIKFGSHAESNPGSRNTIFYLYSRKHGDLERDYNKFQIQPAYFSQGNGNYRDVNQNRRSDIWFNPEINEENVLTFFNLLQTDGFNPLIVKPVTFTLKDTKEFETKLKEIVPDNQDSLKKIIHFLTKPFTPGDLILFTEANQIKLNLPNDDFLGLLLPFCEKNQEAEHGEGFWTDHWTYNLDILENYLCVYPERLKEIVFDKKSFTFYDNTELVKPRGEKYVLHHNQVKQLHALYSDNTKKETIRKRTEFPHTVRTQYGQGEIYKTSLINKLLCLIANKTASLDPAGIGIEMEADKPNWFDALNGLPALSGSSVCETFELKRLLMFTADTLKKTGIEKVSVTEEIYQFLTGLHNLTKDYFEADFPDKELAYWDKTHSLKEEYRHKTKFGLSGKECEISARELIESTDILLKKIDAGINKAFDAKKNIYSAYFINEPGEYESLTTTHVKPLKFNQKKLPLFLESQVHALKITSDINNAKALYRGVKNSLLYDKKLKMYKVTAPLKDMPEEIGRCRVFTPGWLENESIWLHMEYKYLLEILRSGLYKEFYQEFKNLLIPFQKPQRYGRSILENSSFIVSSAFPDQNLHGRGFVARLSGSTAEFLQIWLIMNLGKQPFFLNTEGELNLRFKPILAGWLFSRRNSIYRFNFLSKIQVTYHNSKRKNTFGKHAANIKRIAFNDPNGSPVTIPSNTIPSIYAEQIRLRQIKQIDIYLS